MIENVQRYSAGVFSLVLLLGTLALPYMVNDYYMLIANLAALYLVMSQGLNVLMGFAGQISIGQAGFMALGAYAYALTATHWSDSLLLTLVMTVLTTGVVGAGLGWICLRMRGPYLALVTIGFGVIIQVIALNWLPVTGGPEGLYGLPALRLGFITFNTPTAQYYLSLVLAVLVLLLVKNLRESRVGRAMMAIRDDEIGAAAMGIRVAMYKLLAFVVSGTLAGIGGVLLAAKTTSVFPEEFNLGASAILLMMVVIGGRGSIFGTSVGTIAVVSFFELLRGLREYQMVAYALLVILLIMFRPDGIGGLLEMAFRRMRLVVSRPLTIPPSVLNDLGLDGQSPVRNRTRKVR